MPLKRANIFVSGNVQMAGFRSFVKKIAESLEIKGYAENLSDGRVQIVCEGKEENILQLRKSLIENPPPFSKVGDTEIEFSAFKGEFSTFERNVVTALLKEMVGYMKMFVDKTEVIIQRLDDIKVSLDGMHETLKCVKEDTAQIRQDC